MHTVVCICCGKEASPSALVRGIPTAFTSSACEGTSLSLSIRNQKKATYFYTSNKTEIARVNSKGIITGIGKVTASIRVRYKHKGEFHSAGTFKITVKNSTLKKAYKTLDLTTGESRKPSEYLDGANPDASYIITISSSVVATA